MVTKIASIKNRFRTRNLIIVSALLVLVVVSVVYVSNQWLTNTSPEGNTPLTSPTPTIPLVITPTPSITSPTKLPQASPPSSTSQPTIVGTNPSSSPPATISTPSPTQPATPTPSPSPTPTPSPTPFPSITVVFDFDSGIPPLPAGSSTPFNQTKDDVTAHFSSPSITTHFIVQSYQSLFFKLSLFQGNFLIDDNPQRDILEIKFNRQIESITFDFSTIEYHGGPNDQPSNITLTAYLDSISTTPVGSVSSRGAWISSDSYPQGTLTFNSVNRPFNLVRIELPFQGAVSASDFLVDNIEIKTP